MKQYFAVDPVTGTAYWCDYDELTDTYTQGAEVDPTVLVEWNKKLYNDAPTNFRDCDGGYVAASLPPLLEWQLRQQGIRDDPKKWKQWLNDSENRGFRTRPGRV